MSDNPPRMDYRQHRRARRRGALRVCSEHFLFLLKWGPHKVIDFVGRGGAAE